jgi:transposase
MKGVAPLIEGVDSDALLADKAFDADWLLVALNARGARAIIPPKENRQAAREYDKHAYKWRHLVENFVAKIKEFGAIATRYEKSASSYAANWHLAATVIATG